MTGLKCTSTSMRRRAGVVAMAALLGFSLVAGAAMAGEGRRGGYKPLNNHGGGNNWRGGVELSGGYVGGSRSERFESRLYRSPSGAVLGYPEIRASSDSGFYGNYYKNRKYRGDDHRRRDRNPDDFYDGGYGDNPEFYGAKAGARGPYDAGYGANPEFFAGARRGYDGGYGRRHGSSVRWHRDDRRPHIGRHANDVDHRRYGGGNFGNATIVQIGQMPGQYSPPPGPNQPLVEGDCARDTYCTVRLGPYSNSPKIITVNAQGRELNQRTLDDPQDDPILESPEGSGAKPKIN